MERYESLFAQLKERKEGAFVPFVTLGDPGIEQSLKIIDTLIEAGADALELGIPFSDPLADGPTIQNATLRAFAAGVTPAQCFEMLALIRQKHPTIPIGLLMYANLVFNKGIDEFYAQCEKVGVDSVLVADVPVEESAPFRQAALRHNVAPIFICPPNADSLLRSWLHLFAVTSRRDRRRKPRRVTPQSSGCEAERVQRCTSIAGIWYFRPGSGKSSD